MTSSSALSHTIATPPVRHSGLSRAPNQGEGDEVQYIVNLTLSHGCFQVPSVCLSLVAMAEWCLMAPSVWFVARCFQVAWESSGKRQSSFQSSRCSSLRCVEQSCSDAFSCESTQRSSMDGAACADRV
jgi:hypothetical protein